MSVAYEHAEASAYRSLAERAGLPLLQIAGAVCIASPEAPRLTLFNRVTGLDDVSGDELDEIDAFFDGCADRYAVALEPGAAEKLTAQLVTRGFVPAPAWMKFAQEPVAPPAARETTLHIVEVEDGADFGRSAAGMMPPAFDRMTEALPGSAEWHCFVAYDDERPVARAALHVDGGDVGWLGVAGTLEDARGRGAQTALLAARLRRAAELGLRAVVTETGEKGEDGPGSSYRNILRAGFVESYLRGHLLSPERT